MASTADIVADEHDKQEAAIAAEIEQGAALLDAVVTRIRRALPALSSRVLVHYRSWWISSAQTASKTKHADWRGLLVWGDDEPEMDHPSANRGNFTGEGVWIDSKGNWWMVEYGGIWSRWQGEGDEWEATCTKLSTAEVAQCAGARHVIDAIADAIESHVGTRAKSTQAAQRHAARLAAMRKLF